MTRERCRLQRKKMMGRGANGGCGTEERACSISRVPSKKQPEKLTPLVVVDNNNTIDFYTQALKALTERCPFDSEDVQHGSSSTVCSTLPSGLASFLSKHSDIRKRHKKSSHSADAKSSSRTDKSRGRNFWAEKEEYFRELTVNDIERLNGLSSFDLLTMQQYLSIPFPGDANATNDANGNVNIVDSGAKEDEIGNFMDVDVVKADELPPQEKPYSSGVEWLLGSRSKIYLTSERPSKRRKLLGGEAGLEKLFVAHPVKEVSTSYLCHYCSLGEMGNQLNRLIVCCSCDVAVHQRCYGVQDDEAGSWLCSFCKQHRDDEKGKDIDRPCLICPQKGGALKLVRKREVVSGDNGSGAFAHLFCCQWMPEVYIEDTKTMEPIMNIEGIKETRRKLICYLCKAKYGACVRCSNGACRTSFHPICAREAKHRMEIWGKFGCDDVELRAFCSKHSEVQNNGNTQQVGDQPVAPGLPLSSAVNKLPRLKIGRNGDKYALNMETTDIELDKLGNNAPEDGLTDTRSNAKLQLKCADTQQTRDNDIIEKNSPEDVKKYESLNFTLILKKLIDRGKVNLKDVAAEIGTSPDSLASNLTDDCLCPDLHCKIVKWLRNHSHIGALQKNLKVKIKSKFVSKAEKGVGDDKDAINESESGTSEVLVIKSVPPRRRTKSNIRTVKDNKLMLSSKGRNGDDGIAIDEHRDDHHVVDETKDQNKESFPYAMEKVSIEPNGASDILVNNSPAHEGVPAELLNRSVPGSGQAEEAVISECNTSKNSNFGNDDSVAINYSSDAIRAETLSGSYIHPLVQKKWLQMQNQGVFQMRNLEYDGSCDGEYCPLEEPSSSGICYNGQNHSSTSAELFSKVNVEQLVKAKNMGVLDLSPVDEVEGQLIFCQHRLLCSAVARKRCSDDLIRNVVKCLPWEIDALRIQNWDTVLVNQYLCELREAKKQGRKERRHKEAQAVLAAATAAAAASSRISSFRKDALDEPAHQENMVKSNPYGGRAGLYSQQTTQAKETSRLGVASVLPEKNCDPALSTSELEHPRTCDICRRPETILNPILVCSSCKVAVHLDCYRSVKETTGPWYCELCEDLLSSGSRGAPALNSWQKPCQVAECGLCGGTAGAFRKSSDGQWIHAFCAEWVLESTYRRGQVNLIEGMVTIPKGSDFCLICRREKGICVKCNYGHCQSMFHPSCARSAGFYMNVRTNGGKLQHKAYCGKHSLVERAKAESQKHGVEEWNSLKKVRVELERLRLICERIIKREKLKRELVLCSHEILGSNRNSVASSAWSCSPFFPPDVSSESATTSLKGYMDGYKSGSEALQRSDDITVDSSVAGKRRIKFPMSMDNDQKTDDSSTSQLFTQKPRVRASFSGKQIPYRPSSTASQSTSDDGEKRSKYRKHTETFEKELVMTSDQASMRNQRLPKGFVYVPIRCLSNEKETVPGASSQEHSENDG